MIDAEFDFHNENDYSEFDRDMKDGKLSIWETAVYGCAEYI